MSGFARMLKIVITPSAALRPRTVFSRRLYIVKICVEQLIPMTGYTYVDTIKMVRHKSEVSWENL
jgi:hypothetical protein